VLAHFSLPRLQENWMISADGAGEVYRQFRAANPTEKKAYVLWEPYVSRALQQPGARVLLDSGKLKGYIVDVLVAQREFLRDKPELVRGVVEAYARASYRYASEPDGMAKLVAEDARQTGAESLDAAQAKRIVEGIQWKNTLENYAHFGVVSGGRRLSDDGGHDRGTSWTCCSNQSHRQRSARRQTHDAVYDGFCPSCAPARSIQSGLNVISASAHGATSSQCATIGIAALPPEEWNKLRPVGELRVAPISFARASANLN
jgi:hypothetical protein